jgi:chemotaxis signal transduction protein
VSAGRSFLAFRRAGRRFAVPVEEVREAARVPALTPLPGSAERCAGVALVRGTPVAVLDVVREETRPAAPQGLVLVLESRPFALLVDAVDGVEGGSDATLVDLDALLTERGHG